MTVQRSPATWLSVFPLAQELSDWRPSPVQAVFVDIGGGFGHQCQALKEANLDLKGRVILQELPQILDHVPPLGNIETQVYNFFEPQPIKGTFPQLSYCREDLTNSFRKQVPSSTTYATSCTIGRTTSVS